jgi:hypothetical protein
LLLIGKLLTNNSKPLNSKERLLRQKLEQLQPATLQEHLKLATQYPHLATTQRPEVVTARYRYSQYPTDLDPEEYPRDAPLEPSYAWFASDAMLAAEVLLATGEEWEKTVEELVRRHNTYVCHKYAFHREQYSEDLVKLIDDLDDSEGLCEGDRITRADNESTTYSGLH